MQASTPACAARNLRVAYEGGQGLGGGQLTGTIGFVNVGDTACVLQGVPGFTLLDGAGRVIRTTPSGYRITDRSDPVLMVAGGTSRQAYLPFAWPAIDQSTGGGPCSSAAVARTIRLDLPNGGGTLMLATVSPTGRPAAVAPCHGLLAVGAFQAEPVVFPIPTPHPLTFDKRY